MDENAWADDTVQGCPLQVIDLGILALDVAVNLAKTNVRFWIDLTNAVKDHANWLAYKREFAEHAALEIESLVSEQ